MKNPRSFWIFALLAAGLLSSCKKDHNPLTGPNPEPDGGTMATYRKATKKTPGRPPGGSDVEQQAERLARKPTVI